MEHKFLVVHKSDKSEGIYESYQLIKDILFIKESDFIRHFEHLLQITRSAIFSFAFMVRHEGMKEKRRVFTIRHENYIPKTIQQIKS